jgi:hypothetical protein
MMDKETRKSLLQDRNALTMLVANADAWLASLQVAFAEAEMTDAEINEACAIATRAVIAKAAVTSMTIMRSEG